MKRGFEGFLAFGLSYAIVEMEMNDLIKLAC